MKLNQFTVVVVLESVELKQSKQGMAILELVASTPDAKHTMAFTAFKEKANSYSTSMKPGETWLVTGSLSGRRYQDKSGSSRVANGALINEAIRLSGAIESPAYQPSFNEEDIPF